MQRRTIVFVLTLSSLLIGILIGIEQEHDARLFQHSRLDEGRIEARLDGKIRAIRGSIHGPDVSLHLGGIENRGGRNVTWDIREIRKRGAASFGHR